METPDNKAMQRTALCRAADFATRAEDGNLYIEGYFSTFTGRYEMGDWGAEQVDPCAFDEALGDDVRALVNHNTTLVLGRTKAGTLELRVDGNGLWGRVTINQQDQDAMNLYERVKRGDVDQCSFGFDILSEKTERLPDGRTLWTILKVRLYEVSVVTFPAYQDTAVIARKRDYDAIRERELESWRARMKSKIKKEDSNGT